MNFTSNNQHELSNEQLLKEISSQVTTSNVEDVVAAILNKHETAVNIDTDELERGIERNASEIQSQQDKIHKAIELNKNH